MKKYIFLDIYNTMLSQVSVNENDECLTNFKTILGNTGAEVIIKYSTIFKSLEEKKKFLINCGIDIGDYIISEYNDMGIPFLTNGNYVEFWLKYNIDQSDLLGQDYNYLIVSYNDDILYSQRDNFLQISKSDGFTKSDVVKAISILNRDIIYDKTV